VLTKALRATDLGAWVADNSPFGELLLEGATIKVQFRGEINVDPSDAVRLARLAKLNGQIAKNAADVVKINNKIADLHRQNAELSKLLKKRGAKKGKKIAERIAANKRKIAEATKKLASTKKAGQALMKASAEAAKGLKSKAGRLVGAAVKKIGGKLLLRLVPGLNIALAVLDVITVGKAIYDLATGKARIGLPTGEEGEGGEGGEGGAEGGEGTGGEGAADAGAAAGDASAATGGESTTAPDPEAIPPEIDIESIMSETAEEAPPELEPNAQAVVDELESESSTGAAMGPADLEQLNEVCRDLTPEELAQILEDMSATEGKKKATDAFAVLAEIVRRKRALRAAASQTTVEDESGTHVLVDPETPVPDSPDVAAGKATGQGQAGTGGKEEGGAGPSLSETEPLTDVPEGSSTTMAQFRIVSGYSTETKYAKGSTFSITAEFSGDGRTHLVSFTIKVDSRTEDAGTITLKAHNAVGWKVKDGAIYMPAGAPVEITSTKQ
jgi:hypothetical protein